MSTNASAQDIDLGSLWGRVRRSLPIIMVGVLAAGFLTFALVSLMAPRYEAEAQLTITAKRSNPYGSSKNDAGAAASVTPRLDPAAINTHVRALMAPDLLLKVAKELGLAQRAEFNSAVGPVDTLDAVKGMLGLGRRPKGDGVETRVLGAMQKNLSVSAARESRFITIRFRSTDPQIAADVANMIAKSYRETLREIPVRETNEAVAALTPKIEKLSSEVLQAEADAKRFRAETDQLTGGGAQSLTLQQQRLSTLSADLVRAEGERAKSESRLRAAQELLAGGSANTLPEVQNSRIIQDLISQRVRVERQVNEARAVLLNGHPRMRQLNADLGGLRRSIRRETRTIVNSISKEVRLSQLRTEQLRAQVAELKKGAIARSGDEAKLRSLEATAKSKRNELERLQKQLEDNRTVVDTNRVPVESTIVSAARADQDAVFPKKGPFTLLAMTAAFMLGLFVVIARGLMAIGRPVAHKTVAPQSAPARATLTGSLRARTGEAPASATAGAVSAMSGYVHRFSRGPQDPSGFRLLIAGADKSVDPSDEAIELATELSEAGGRVLLVDWTLNGEPLLSDVDVGQAASIVDLIADKAQFEDVITPLSDTNVQYAYASQSPANEELSDERGVNLVLDACDEIYDQVIVFGRHDDAAALFETIEGRFDAGMVVFDKPIRSKIADKNEFLGFDVAEIDIIHHVRGEEGAPTKRNGRMMSN